MKPSSTLAPEQRHVVVRMRTFSDDEPDSRACCAIAMGSSTGCSDHLSPPTAVILEGKVSSARSLITTCGSAGDYRRDRGTSWGGAQRPVSAIFGTGRHEADDQVVLRRAWS